MTSSFLNQITQTSIMKTIPELISEIHVDAANFEHIAKTGKINGTLYLGIRDAMAVFACQEVIEALKLHGIVDPSTQKNEFVIPDVMPSVCVRGHCLNGGLPYCNMEQCDEYEPTTHTEA